LIVSEHQNVQVEDDVPVAQPDDPQVLADQYRTQLEAERSARMAETQRRQQAEAKVETFGQEADAANANAVTVGTTALEQRVVQMKREYATALREGEYEKATDLQYEMTVVAQDLSALRREQTSIETKRQQQLQPKPEPARNTEWQPLNNAQAESHMANSTPQTAAWLRRHPEYYTDRGFQAQVSAAHSLAVAKGHKPDTSDYFRFVEDSVGVSPKETAPTSRQPAPVQAGSVRRVDDYGSRAPSADNMPAEARRFAEAIGADPISYWKEHQSLVRAGTIKNQFGG